MKPIIGAIIMSAIGLFGIWLSGYNFDQRGAQAVFSLLLSVCFAVAGFCLGKIWEGEKI